MLEDPATIREAPPENDLRSAGTQIVRATKIRVSQLLDLAAAETRLAMSRGAPADRAALPKCSEADCPAGCSQREPGSQVALKQRAA